MKTLIVEDSQALARVISNILQKIGITNIKQVGDKRRALRMHMDYHFDLVFVDWDLPDNAGLKTVEGFREIDQESCIVVVANGSRRDSVILAAKAGANHYLVRPLSEDSVRSKLQKFIETHEPEPEDV